MSAKSSSRGPQGSGRRPTVPRPQGAPAPLVAAADVAEVLPSKRQGLTILTGSSGTLTVSEVYDSYWRFAAERQAIFFRRLISSPAPWTSDAILAHFKFTNAYRASDRTSQYLIRNVIYREDLPDSPQEVVFRILLFKFFNRIPTWELLQQALGAITFADYNVRRYDAILSQARNDNRRLYSAAYIMPPGGSRASTTKHQTHLQLLDRMMRDALPQRLADARSMREGFELFRAYPTIGSFLAYQFVTDVNYSECINFSEMEFVVPGPGARDGLRKCFVDSGGLSDSDLIRYMAELQEREFGRLGLDFRSLWGRPLQLIDCQNLFCETDKYARLRHPQIKGRTGRTRIKQRFHPNMAGIHFFYPPKWGLNDKLQARVNGQVGGFTSLEATQPRLTDVGRQENRSMDLNSYQQEALRTDRTGGDANSFIVPMLGLAGEAGQLLSEYKKRLRDGDTHVCFKDRVREELGDLLWYLANVASKFDLSLADVARSNLTKVRARWAVHVDESHGFDATAPATERLPRNFCVELQEIPGEDQQHVRVSIDGERFGDELTDNAYFPDGYRFHDVFHFAYAAVLGWSPITRSLLRRKRKSCPALDEVEDGGRAAAIEEGVAALVFDYARRHEMLRGVKALDYDLLRIVQGMTSHLEVKRCTTGEWEEAILQGFAVWREVVAGRGGYVSVDLDRRRIRYMGQTPPQGAIVTE